MIAGCFGHEGLCQLRTEPKRPAIIVIHSATYLLTISSPDDPSTPPNVTQHYRTILERSKLYTLVRTGQ